MSSTKHGRGSDKFVVRLPDGMRGRIANAAREAGRSMNAEIVAALEEVYPAVSEADPNKMMILFGQKLTSLLRTMKSIEPGRRPKKKKPAPALESPTSIAGDVLRDTAKSPGPPKR